MEYCQLRSMSCSWVSRVYALARMPKRAASSSTSASRMRIPARRGFIMRRARLNRGRVRRLFASTRC